MMTELAVQQDRLSLVVVSDGPSSPLRAARLAAQARYPVRMTPAGSSKQINYTHTFFYIVNAWLQREQSQANHV